MVFDGAAARLRREQDGRAWLAWHVEALRRVKKLPRLESMLAKRPARRQTWQEQLAIMQAWSVRVNRRAARED